MELEKVNGKIIRPLKDIKVKIGNKNYDMHIESLKWKKGEPIWSKEGIKGINPNIKFLPQNDEVFHLFPTNINIQIYSRFRNHEQEVEGYIIDDKFLLEEDYDNYKNSLEK